VVRGNRVYFQRSLKLSDLSPHVQLDRKAAAYAAWWGRGLRSISLCTVQCQPGSAHRPKVIQRLEARASSVSGKSDNGELLVIRETCFMTDQHSQIFVPPGITLDEALDKPFHVYDPAFYDIIGSQSPEIQLPVVRKLGSCTTVTEPRR
jgi:hypothetical protein